MENISSILEALLDDNSSESSDAYLEDLQIQEFLWAAFVETPTSSIEAPQNQASSTQICCHICTEDKEEDEMFQIHDCSHSFCSLCISKYIESKLQDNVTSITCPGDDCTNIITPSSCDAVVPSNVTERWELALIESSILPSEKYYCPYNDCSGMLVNDNGEGIIIRASECPNCRRLFCANCDVSWHQDLSCDEFKRSKQDTKEKELLTLLAEENKWKECPNCKVFVDKNEGCIHMTCRCKFEFCYICGLNWDDDHWTTCQ